jgi:hypothetical protein
MAGDDSRAPSPLLVALRLTLDGARPSGTLEWVSAAVPTVTRAATGAGHWAAGRRQRALAEWASAAGSGVIAWGLGTEAPARAEMDKNIPQTRDLLAKLGKLPPKAPATGGTPALTDRQRSRFARINVAFSVVGMVTKVRYDLRHPRRLTVNAIAGETINTAFYVLRAARAVQRRRPRTAAGSALAAAGSLARLRAASAEPLE